ncbi:MAG: hypothetical protein F6K54_23465 [Okeania sp. SIO3B5]|uniref:hypothetical protein n=1 Tax=Okeania sp. SIO3B5 TaxID=2607811 RepID=UPI00140085B2|nr:hypothetical protein [Okeania sp. SIO3B5]NEO55767.1 hypothetical protein [Okeania sp. SIO3B5]
MVVRRQEAGGRRQKVFFHCHLNFIHAPMLSDMILNIKALTDIGCRIFLSQKVSAFWWQELHKASIFRRLWQKNHSYNFSDYFLYSNPKLGCDKSKSR